jgi:hypothetical protein
MPTALRTVGLRVVICPNDGEAAFNLHCPGEPPALRESHGFKLTDRDRIEDTLAAAIIALCRE